MRQRSALTGKYVSKAYARRYPHLVTRRTQAKADDFIPQMDFWRSGYPARTHYPYRRDIGEGLGSNVVMACMNWVMRNFPQAKPCVKVLRGEIWQSDPMHDLAWLIKKPNPFYNGTLLLQATSLSHWLDGNSYWLKVRNRFGDVLQLWYLPHFLVCPKWPQDGSEFISHYEYTPQGSARRLEIPVRDMVHLRFGLDPENLRLGLSTLKPLLREVITDEEASNFAWSILRNMGVPGVVISPKSDKALPSEKDAEKLKEYIRNNFSGDKRGEALAFGVPTEISQFGFDPNQLMLGSLRDISEERTCATFGIPAAVVGFGSGLQSTKVGATMRELRQMAWTDCMIPQQDIIAEQITDQLMPDFQSQSRRFRFEFDTSTVAAFLEEEEARARRVSVLVTTGILRVDRAQAMLGLEVDQERQIYLGPAPAPLEVVEPEPENEDQDDEDDDIPPGIAARMNGTGGNSED